VVYGAALERRFAGNCIEGSNPSPSAKLCYVPGGTKSGKNILAARLIDLNVSATV
jgi:hypothetical protein